MTTLALGPQGSARVVYLCVPAPEPTLAIMGKYTFGWPDLLLPIGLGASLTGHFYTAMGLLAVYAVLYHRATHRRRPRHRAE